MGHPILTPCDTRHCALFPQKPSMEGYPRGTFHANQHHHRTIPHQECRADPLDDAPGARIAPTRSSLQLVPASRRRCAHRSAHRLRHRRHVDQSMGGRDAGRRKLRRQPQLRSLSRVHPGHLRLPACDSDAPGPRRRAHPVQHGVPQGRRHPQQHALRHHPRQYRIRRGRGGGLPIAEARHPQHGIPSKAIWMWRRWRS